MFHRGTLYSFNNIGYTSEARSFPGFAKKSEAAQWALPPRQALRIEMGEGDLLSIEDQGDQIDSNLSLYAGVFDHNLVASGHPLGVELDCSLTRMEFDTDELDGWLDAMGRGKKKGYAVTRLNIIDGLVILKARSACTVWIIRPAKAHDVVSAAHSSVIRVSHKPSDQHCEPSLPPLLGAVREEFTVKRGSALAYEVHPGEVVQIIDVEGQQCSDFVAFRKAGLDRGIELMIDSTATRTMVRRSYPGPGLFDKFFDQEMRPILNVVQDTCGRHDAFGVACTARGYEERGFPGHVNCSDNISFAAAPYGVRERNAWPAINFFWNTWVDAHHYGILTEESYSRPGDYIAMRAMDELVCVTTACPDEIDPINGWNPTDIHVRIYKSDAPIRRVVGYREKEDAPMSISQESAFQSRTAPLTSHFAPARDLWTPVSYPSIGTIGEYWACRERVTLQDMSGLRKYDIVGPDAERLLQEAMTRDIARLAVWRGSYSLMCDETGAVIDDGTLFRLGPELFRWCCGTEESGRVLEALAKSSDLHVRIHALGNALPNLALQGPRSRDVLDKLIFTQPNMPALHQIKWFGATIARTDNRDGIPFMLTRSGYTGELGYEIFCTREHGPAIWDKLMEAGDEFGIAPMGNAALDIIRIEAGLAAANAEFAPGVDAFEAGLGFAVKLDKTHFTGQAALRRNAENSRKALKGLKFEGDDVPLPGAHVFDQERPIGVITSATRSPMFECTIAMARLAIEYSKNGTQLQVGQMDGHMKRLNATVVDTPFFDPKRERARA